MRQRGDAPSAAPPECLDEDAARAFLERLRWPAGPLCPHCGARGAYRLKPKPESTRPVRKGVLKCRACRRQFTVKVGTALVQSHIPLNKWLEAVRHLSESRTPLSAYKLHKLVGVSARSGWLMARCIRQVLRPDLAGGVTYKKALAKMMSPKPRGTPPPRQPRGDRVPPIGL